jgi:hypothetical protein
MKTSSWQARLQACGRSPRPHRAGLWCTTGDAPPAACAALAQRAARARHTPRAGTGAHRASRPYPQTGTSILLLSTWDSP